MIVNPVGTIVCPWCGVGSGKPCLTAQGRQLEYYHKVRHRAYEKLVKEQVGKK